MKVRLLAMMALVVVGVMAGTSPAMAAKKKARTASAWSKQHKDNKAFGEAINNLRQSQKITDGALQSVTAQALSALTQLNTGLTSLAASYTDFEYGFVQLGTTVASNGEFRPIPGAGVATPRIDPTAEQSTVTAQFSCSADATGACPVGPGALGSSEDVRAQVAVRSVNPKNDEKSTALCRMSITQALTGTAANMAVAQGLGYGGFLTTTPQAANGNVPAVAIPRSPLPTASSPATFPLELIASDKSVNMTGTGLAGGANSSGTGATASFRPAYAMPIFVTLSCLSKPNA
jgi:hypothetical protein